MRGKKLFLVLNSFFYNYTYIACIFLLECSQKHNFVVYLCGCEWLYGTYFGRFWGFMVDYKVVAMGQVFPLG